MRTEFTINGSNSRREFKALNIVSSTKLIIDYDGDYHAELVSIVDHISRHSEKYPVLSTLVVVANSEVPVENFGFLAGIRGLKKLSLCVEYLPHLLGIENLTRLRSLRIAPSGGPHTDLAGIEYLGNLETLTLEEGDFRNMELINQMSGLKGLRIALLTRMNSKILDLSGLDSLKELIVEETGFRKIKISPNARLVRLDTPISPVSEIEGLNPSKLLYFFGSCSKFKDLNFLEGARRLKVLSVCENPLNSIRAVQSLKDTRAEHVCFGKLDNNTLRTAFPPSSIIETAYFSMDQDLVSFSCICDELVRKPEYRSYLGPEVEAWERGDEEDEEVEDWERGDEEEEE